MHENFRIYGRYTHTSTYKTCTHSHTHTHTHKHVHTLIYVESHVCVLSHPFLVLEPVSHSRTNCSVLEVQKFTLGYSNLNLNPELQTVTPLSRSWIRQPVLELDFGQNTCIDSLSHISPYTYRYGNKACIYETYPTTDL